jgi:hypothetical protein
MPSRIDDLREHIAALARALESELVAPLLLRSNVLRRCGSLVKPAGSMPG